MTQYPLLKGGDEASDSDGAGDGPEPTREAEVEAPAEPGWLWTTIADIAGHVAIPFKVQLVLWAAVMFFAHSNGVLLVSIIAFGFYGM